jgi:hypothetical protein
MSGTYRNGVELVRPYEPDYPGRRNPWDPKEHPENYNYVQTIIERVDTEMVRPPKYSNETRLEVYRLRDEGFTLRQIADVVGVSKSTACLYIQKYRKQQAALKATVQQPGTSKVVETSYSLNEINVGKIKSIAPKTSNSEA